MLTLFRIITVAVGILILFLSDVFPAAKFPQIGVLLLSDGGGAPIRAFRRGLNDLGYVEEKTIFIEYRFARGKPERISQLAAELINKKVNLILTAGTAQARAIRQLSNTIPIVLAISGDPVATGLAASLARPGGNITGLSMISPEVSGKRLELLKETAPSSSRVGVLWDSVVPENRLDFQTTQAAAKIIGLTVESLQIGGVDDLENAFSVACSAPIERSACNRGWCSQQREKKNLGI